LSACPAAGWLGIRYGLAATPINGSDAFVVTDRIRFATQVNDLQPAWRVDGEPFDAVILASGRFRAPVLPAGLGGFTGEVLHAFDYPGVDHFRDRRVLVYGNGVSGHEIASELAMVTSVISAYRKPRYVLRRTWLGSRRTGSGTPTSARCGGR
jgi:cation diffusion facilitator CzcD-associated flavoprotein CzcO